ncbi:MAG: hypothetical protein L3J23_03225 [Flavobacteriaceae bacterium]|nr:hypothetical protein [Flavobacteriaceae bacterium]
MHKKLEAELVSLAHQILQMKNKDDVVKLRDKAKDAYEKLSVLAFVNHYFLTTPNAVENKEELINNIDKAKPIKEKPTKEVTVKEPTLKKEVVVKEPILKEDSVSKAIEKQNENIIKAEAEEIVNKIITQKVTNFKEVSKNSEQVLKDPIKEGSLANNEEFKDSIPADVAADLFEKANKLRQTQNLNKITSEQRTVKKEQNPEVKASLNDRIFSQKIQVGLNDRIAFVKHLFNFSQEDFNHVLSQLNAFNTETESKHFITNRVKLDYNWDGKEEYEERLIILIERRFM